MALKPLTDWLVYLVVRLVLCLILSLRLETGYALARLDRNKGTGSRFVGSAGGWRSSLRDPSNDR